jgi:hypothetical protein
MTQEHPITPPEELVEQWCHKWSIANGDFGPYLATQAALWGYEQRGAVNEAELQKARDEELEACCEWLGKRRGWEDVSVPLRAARRPKPPSSKEQALEALDEEQAELSIQNYKLIRTVLESIPDQTSDSDFNG